MAFRKVDISVEFEERSVGGVGGLCVSRSSWYIKLEYQFPGFAVWICICTIESRH